MGMVAEALLIWSVVVTQGLFLLVFSGWTMWKSTIVGLVQLHKKAMTLN